MSVASNTAAGLDGGSCRRLPPACSLALKLPVWLLAAAVIFLATSLGSEAKPAERVNGITAAAEPVIVHDRGDGWAEAPALDATASAAFVAYQATEGEYGSIYLARVPRTGGALGRPEALVRLDRGREIAAWPSAALETRRGSGGESEARGGAQAERIWVAWNSCRSGRWAVKACLVECGGKMKVAGRRTVSEPGGFQSQVRVRSAFGVTCFVWARWDRGSYSILARTADGNLGRIIKVYEGRNPVGRPDAQIVGPDRILFAWDEYVGGGFAVRAREMASGDLRGIRTFYGPPCDQAAGGTPGADGPAEGQAWGDLLGGALGEAGAGSGWEPHLAGSASEVILAWSAVRSGSTAYGPLAWAGATGTFDPGKLSLPADDTWRVRCFSDSEGALYLAWTTRVFFRTTGLYVRRITPPGAAVTCRVDFRMDKNFMNTFDCKMDRDVLVAWDHSGAIYLGRLDSSAIRAGDGPSGSAGAPEGLAAAGPGSALPAGPGDWADAALDEEAWAGGSGVEAGAVLKERASEEAGAWAACARHAVFYQGESLQVYFGDYHNHTSFSDGRAYADILFLGARDGRRLDFAGVTDHDVTVTPGELAWTAAVAKHLSAAGDFAALYGFEASKGWAHEGFGHWSVLFPGAGEVLHFEPGMTPPDLYRFTRRLGALAIPHHVAKRFAPHDWSWFDPVAERAVEMCSLHGIFESLRGNEGKPDMVEGRFVEDGLARGYVFGFVGGSDSHNCFADPAGMVGITGVYATELTARALLDAVAARRTFALTAGRTVLDFRCNGRLMGEEMEAGGDLDFEGYARSPDSIVSAEIVSEGEVVWRSEPRAEEAAIAWRAPAPASRSYYYLRVATSTGDLAWSSPIWITPTR